MHSLSGGDGLLGKQKVIHRVPVFLANVHEVRHEPCLDSFEQFSSPRNDNEANAGSE